MSQQEMEPEASQQANEPRRPGPQPVSGDELRRRLAILERQQMARDNGDRMTDEECAASLGITRSAWISWKRHRLKKAPPQSHRLHPPQASTVRPAGQATEDASALKRSMIEAFERGERAIQTLERIRKLIDDCLGK